MTTKKDRKDNKRLKEGCSCLACRECCSRDPGWFIPEEIPIAARYKGLTEQEFVARFCAEHLVDDVLALSPATKSSALHKSLEGRPGKPATKPRSTACIFLNRDGLCDIHPVKPYECRKVYGCAPDYRHKRVREIIAKMWR